MEKETTEKHVPEISETGSTNEVNETKSVKGEGEKMVEKAVSPPKEGEKLPKDPAAPAPRPDAKVKAKKGRQRLSITVIEIKPHYSYGMKIV